MNHITHEELPSGFNFADRLQVESFMQTGSVDGASKVCLVAGAGELPRLACRLRPPRHWDAGERIDYTSGWEASRSGEVFNRLDHSHHSRYALGYRDAAENRMKWHLAYCANHGDHAEGCQR